MVTRSTEEYLRAIYLIQQREGGQARSVSLAQRLNVSKTSVSEMIRNLAAKGYVRFQSYGKIMLTPKGQRVARVMTFKHRVLETFLYRKLKLPMERIHQEACAMEHAVSTETICKLYAFIGRPSMDPHGEPIIV